MQHLQKEGTMKTSTPINAPVTRIAWVFGAVLWLAVSPASVLAAKPTVVLILADDMGYGDVQSLNPASTIATPNLDALAASGMTFIDAHSPSAVCTPTRYGLLTGRYCWRSRLKRGVLGGYSEPLLEPGRRTIADMLKDNGYRTGAVGKWHLGMSLPMHSEEADRTQWDGDPGVDFEGTITNGPTHHGFDSYFGVSASLDMAPYVFVRDDGFTMKPTIQQPAVKFPHFVRKGPRSADFVIEDVLDRLTEEAVGFIQHASSDESPYFLYLPLTGPHKPTQPHARFQGKTGLKEYGDFVHQVDWTVGQVLAAVDASGEADQTLVVFTSDNGSYMYRYDDADRKDHTDDTTVQGYRSSNHRANGALRGTKADIWEAGHRVPCFVRWPGQIAGGVQSPTTICHTDWFATLADVIDAEIANDEAEDSASILSVLRSSDGGDVMARGAPVVHHSGSGMFAIREGRWKLVCGNGSGGREAPKGKPFDPPFTLFDLQSDLSEQRDQAQSQPELVQQLTDTLEEIRDSGRSVQR